MTPNNGRVSLNEDSWVKLSEDREDVFEQESRMDPRENPLVNSWDNVRNLEWPDDRLPEEKPELPEAAQERDQAFDTPRSRAHDYVTEFDLYAMN
ncbi:hypothetical protein KGD82_01005 [Nocardiopsis eucommiae]|uniref:Uncharacterized protein n=2 Tax=Nocardiopsis TaxID=2013 RepID=A0A975LAP3_9ACTN|nr:hypothetical protein KGD82_01005 [Nocardiopsis eucommiae]